MKSGGRQRRSSADAGDSLVEVLVALAVLGVGITAIMLGLGTNITTSVTNRSQSEAVAALNSAAEYVKSLDNSTLCAAVSPVSVPGSAVAAPPGFTITYGPASGLGSDPCSVIAVSPVQIAGNGFQTLRVSVVKRG
jgi:type II secretory pathway pseudopilin PulG